MVNPQFFDGLNPPQKINDSIHMFDQLWWLNHVKSTIFAAKKSPFFCQFHSVLAFLQVSRRKLHNSGSKKPGGETWSWGDSHVQSHGGTLVARWMVYFMENPNIKWMMTGGTPILGNLDISVFFDKQCHWTMVVFECILIDNTGRRLRQDLDVRTLNELLDDADDMAVMMVVAARMITGNASPWS